MESPKIKGKCSFWVQTKKFYNTVSWSSTFSSCEYGGASIQIWMCFPSIFKSIKLFLSVIFQINRKLIWNNRDSAASSDVGHILRRTRIKINWDLCCQLIGGSATSVLASIRQAANRIPIFVFFSRSLTNLHSFQLHVTNLLIHVGHGGQAIHSIRATVFSPVSIQIISF